MKTFFQVPCQIAFQSTEENWKARDKVERKYNRRAIQLPLAVGGLLQNQNSWCPLPPPKIQFHTLNKSAGENWGKIAYKQAEKLFRDNKDISGWAGLFPLSKIEM